MLKQCGLLRQELPADSVDDLAPVRNGGVHLQKLFGVMHDTCHAANKVATSSIDTFLSQTG